MTIDLNSPNLLQIIEQMIIFIDTVININKRLNKEWVRNETVTFSFW